MKKISNLSSKEDAVRSVVFCILVAVIVAFAYWCYQIQEYRDNPQVGVTPRGSAAAATANSQEYRKMAFEGAVVGFLLIYAVVRIYKRLY